VSRNIGNMVPAYGEMLGGVSAVIEFAVTSLKVRHIVVCGHTHCGAMQALLDPKSVERMPTVKSWLENAHAALEAAEKMQERATAISTGERMIDVLTEQNVLLQMKHLKTHPSVALATAKGELTISGWIYCIGTGEVCVAEDGQQTFTPIGLQLPTGV
jgi:carbonic anhydrase